MPQVKMDIKGRIAIIRIERYAALNALSREIVDKIDTMIDQINMDETINCLLFYSEKNFAAGADIKWMMNCTEEEAKAFSFSPTYNKIADLSIPVIAAIEGYALGGGMELAMTADIRIAGESAKVGFPEITLGIFPGAGGTIRVPKIIGEAMAKELILTGRIISSSEAKKIGLINKVVADKEVYLEGIRLAERLAEGASIAIKSAKATIKEGIEESNLNKAIQIEAENWAKLFNTYDQKEGMRAFSERRKPIFKHR